MGRGFYKKVLSNEALRKNVAPASLIEGLKAKPGEGVALAEFQKKAAPAGADEAKDRGGSAAEQNKIVIAIERDADGSAAEDISRHPGDIAAGSQGDTAHPVAGDRMCGSDSPAAGAAFFGDVEVCDLLKLERYKLVACRKPGNRGTDWEIVGEQVGMSAGWVKREAMLRGMSAGEAESAVGKLKPIAKTDGVISCRIVGVWPNLERVTVEVLADGRREVAEVPRIDLPPTNLDTQPMGIGWNFDAMRCGGELKWMRHLNYVSYYRSRA